MPEIKVDPERVEPVLSSLKQRIQELNTSHSNPNFTSSTLNFLDKIQNIEGTYYEALNRYKTSLEKIEQDMEKNIQEYKDTDESVAKQMG